MTQLDLKKAFIIHAIAMDAQYVGRFISTTRLVEQTLGGLASMWLTPYISLFAYESSLKLRLLYDRQSDEPEFTEEVRKIVKRSRHTLKLFDDTARGLDGQVAWYRDEVIDPFKKRFIERIKIPFLRRFGWDLGIFLYDGVPVGNTHAAAFLLGVDTDILIGPSERAGEVLTSTTTEYGQYFALWGAQLDPTAKSFITAMDSSRFVPGRDVRSQEYYASIFNGTSTPDVNALLSLFQVLMNIVATLLPLDTAAASRQTITKLQFLTTYHVIRSLKQLASSYEGKLTDVSWATLNQITCHEMAVLVTSDAAKPLRISLMHYDVYSKIELSDLAIDHLLYGLVEASLSIPVEQFATQLQELTAYVADRLNNWERLGSG